MKKISKYIYFLTPADNATKVTKWVIGEGDSVYAESSYLVTKMGCNCKAFKFRQSCKHMDMVMYPPENRIIYLADAMKIVGSFIDKWKGVFRFVGLPEEPYERDENGKVIGVTVIFRDAYIPSDVLYSGVWVGWLKDSGLRVRMIVENKK